MHVETEGKACASLGRPLVFHLRYAFQVLQIRSQYLNPGNCRVSSLIKSNDTITQGPGNTSLSLVDPLRFLEIPSKRQSHGMRPSLNRTRGFVGPTCSPPSNL